MVGDEKAPLGRDRRDLAGDPPVELPQPLRVRGGVRAEHRGARRVQRGQRVPDVLGVPDDVEGIEPEVRVGSAVIGVTALVRPRAARGPRTPRPRAAARCRGPPAAAARNASRPAPFTMKRSADATAAASRGAGSQAWGSDADRQQRLDGDAVAGHLSGDVREERLGGDDPGARGRRAARARGEREGSEQRQPRRIVLTTPPLGQPPVDRRQSGQRPVSSSQWLCTVKPVCARADRASVPMAHPENSTVRRQRSQVTWWPWADGGPQGGRGGHEGRAAVGMVEALHEAEGLEEVEGTVDGDRGQARVDGPPALEELGRRRAVRCRAQRLHDRAPCPGVGAAGAGEACQQPLRLAVAVKLKLFFNFHRSEHTPGAARGSRREQRDRAAARCLARLSRPRRSHVLAFLPPSGYRGSRHAHQPVA